MNKDNAHLFLPLVQALAEGKTIEQSNCDGSWKELEDPAFNRPVGNYRIKPEPREFTVFVSDDNSCVLHSNQPNPTGYGKGSHKVRVREILD